MNILWYRTTDGKQWIRFLFKPVRFKLPAGTELLEMATGEVYCKVEKETEIIADEA